jgi:hypothetical protein
VRNSVNVWKTPMSFKRRVWGRLTIKHNISGLGLKGNNAPSQKGGACPKSFSSLASTTVDKNSD